MRRDSTIFPPKISEHYKRSSIHILSGEHAGMEARSERINGVLIFFVSGRLDAFGAQQLNVEVHKGLHDDDQNMVIDMTDSPYLSSGGIRVFNSLNREMKRRNGRLVLAAVSDYSMKVLAIAGFTTVIEIFPTASVPPRPPALFSPSKNLLNSRQIAFSSRKIVYDFKRNHLHPQTVLP